MSAATLTRQHGPRAAIRAVEGDGRTFTAWAVKYGVTDDYGTIFAPGCFTESLRQRLPRIAWGHDWRDLVGQVTDYDDRREGLHFTGRLDDPDAVPRARQAAAQLKSGTVSQVSIGFIPQAYSDRADGVRVFTKCRLDEVSLVLAGAVPGADVTGVRSAHGRHVRRYHVADTYALETVGTLALHDDDALAAVADYARSLAAGWRP